MVVSNLGSPPSLRLDLGHSWQARSMVRGPTLKYLVAVKKLGQDLIQTAIQEARGSPSEAARILGVHPNYLHRLIRNLNLKVSFQPSPEELQRILRRKL